MPLYSGNLGHCMVFTLPWRDQQLPFQQAPNFLVQW